MIKFQHHYNFLLHKLVKYFVDLIIYKKIFVYNFFIKNFSFGETCFSYYSVKLNDVDFNDATFKFLKFDQSINFKNKNINMIFLRKKQ